MLPANVHVKASFDVDLELVGVPTDTYMYASATSRRSDNLVHIAWLSRSQSVWTRG